MCRLKRKYVLQPLYAFTMPHLPHVSDGKYREMRGFEESNRLCPFANIGGILNIVPR